MLASTCNIEIRLDAGIHLRYFIQVSNKKLDNFDKNKTNNCLLYSINQVKVHKCFPVVKTKGK